VGVVAALVSPVHWYSVSDSSKRGQRSRDRFSSGRAPSVARSVIVQGGAYAEHQIVSVSDGKTTMEVNAPTFPVRLAPGAGAKLTIRMRRFGNDPTLSFPWESTIADLGNPPVIANDARRSGGAP